MLDVVGAGECHQLDGYQGQMALVDEEHEDY
jgi:hypothetical protein